MTLVEQVAREAAESSLWLQAAAAACDKVCAGRVLVLL